LSPPARRRAVRRVTERLEVSERRACRVLGQARSAQRYSATESDLNERLRERLVQLAWRHARYGYRRMAELLRRDGWRVNAKRVERLWRLEGLRVPKRQHKRRRLGSRVNGCIRRRAEYPNHVWGYDFLMDRTADGRRLKVLTVVDEHTRECLAIDVGRKLKAQDVLERMANLFVTRGTPAFIRSDNGPEFVNGQLRDWLGRLGVETLFIEVGSPWENGYVESFHGKLRDELLNREVFDTVLEARVLTEDWRREYNERRPHSSLGYRSPAAAAYAAEPVGPAL
jgi:putative transposase